MILHKRPLLKEVTVKDGFWTPYLENIRTVTIPHVFKKFEETEYIKNYEEVAKKSGAAHSGPSFSDGLVLESIRGTADFLALYYDEKTDKYLDELIKKIGDAADPDGFISTRIIQDNPDWRWGENGGDIISSHCLYNHGALIEAAIAHYNATGKKSLLKIAVKAANLICGYIGYSPKKEIVPGHSLPEEAFIKLYKLFRDDTSLKDFAEENNVNKEDYLDIVGFWFDKRGNSQTDKFSKEYHQNHLPFLEQTTAEGHAVRAGLFYAGATTYAIETENQKFKDTLDILWDNVTSKKLHINGGIGARHDIEGFDKDYELPNDAYLETCAAIAMCFWNGEMELLEQNAKYFDCFELSLYNNVLSAIGPDFTHYFYENPLINTKKLHRWEWHGCPCCPPMLLKLYSSLGTYIYSLGKNEVCINMYIGSELKTDLINITQDNKAFRINSKGKEITLKFRIPAYADNFGLSLNGTAVDYAISQSYAVITGTFDGNVQVKFDELPKRIFANPRAEADKGMVSFIKGPHLLCAEGIDNNGNIEFEIAKKPQLEATKTGAKGKTADGNEFILVPYYNWGNRNNEDEETLMAVWFKQEGMYSDEKLDNYLNGKLYGNYDKV